MSTSRRSICLIAGGISERNYRLQPWCYLLHVARGLAKNGHQVTVLSDGHHPQNDEKNGEPCVRMVDGVAVRYIDSVNDPLWHSNAQLHGTVTALDPDVVLLHVGLTSFIHQRMQPRQRPDGKRIPTVGIFTSPLYSTRDFQQIGIIKAIRNRALSGTHMIGTLAPKWLIRRRMGQSGLHALVTQMSTTRQQLLDRRLWLRHIQVVPPGIDPEWRVPDGATIEAMRTELGYAVDDTVIVYFGSPSPLRGLHTLLAAFRSAVQHEKVQHEKVQHEKVQHEKVQHEKVQHEKVQHDLTLKLLILSRRHMDELAAEDAHLHALLTDSEIAPRVKVVSGFLEKDLLVRHIAASDIAALPFELVPSDAPLSLLEAQALGKPVVTSDLVCLPELIERGHKFLARPADPKSLATALLEAANFHVQNAANFQQNEPPTPRAWQAMGQEWSEFVQLV